MSKTVNRGWLKRRILEGKVEAKCNYKYSDDYAYDAAVNFNKSEQWLPARITEPHTNPETGRYDQDRREGFMNFDASDFRNYGRAWLDDDGTICLYFGYRSYTLRLVAQQAA